MSGTHRPPNAPGLTDAIGSPFCQLGWGKMALTPPPVLPPLPPISALIPSPFFQTTSRFRPLLLRMVVPPTDRTYGLEAGKLTWAYPSSTAPVEPSSPVATQTVMPSIAASCRVSLICDLACGVQKCMSSAAP